MIRSPLDDRLLQWRSRSGALESSGPAQKTLERKVRVNRWALLIERLWPLLWLPTTVIGLFLLVSLLGLWPLLRPQSHVIGLTIFGVALLAALLPVVRVRWPTRDEGLQRLERLSNVPHRPASAYDDQLSDANMASGPSSRLWQAHRQRLERLIAGLQLRGPLPRVEARDPLALRVLLLLGVGLAAVTAGDAFKDRLASPFRIMAGMGGSNVRLDAWVTPPVYTGMQPILLIDGAKSVDPESQSARIVTVPEGSQLSVRAAGEGHGDFTVQSIAANGAATTLEQAAESATPTGVAEFRANLLSNLTVKVLNGSREQLSWAFNVTPDKAPIVTLTNPPGHGARGALTLEYRVQDDFGVAAAHADFELLSPLPTKPLKLADGSEIGPLAASPALPLKLPKSRSRRDVRGKTSQDLTAHPWAGLNARMILSARDQAGKIGSSVPVELAMPARNFQDPLARAIIEQRRKLALSPARSALAAASAAGEDYKALVCVFPELGLSAYSCEDLFHQRALLRASEAALGWLLQRSRNLPIAAFVGAGGYGERIVSGLALNDNATLLAGAIPAASLLTCSRGGGRSCRGSSCAVARPIATPLPELRQRLRACSARARLRMSQSSRYELVNSILINSITYS